MDNRSIRDLFCVRDMEGHHDSGVCSDDVRGGVPKQRGAWRSPTYADDQGLALDVGSS